MHAPPSLPTPLASAAVPDDFIWRLSVRQYHEMIEAGILTEDDPVELLEGWLVLKMPKKPAHTLATQLARTALQAMLPAGWYVETQEPLTTADSEPEPDVMVVRGSPRDYRNRHPGGQDVALVVEVADASLERDRGAKSALYAAAGVPEYWIINLPETELEVHARPEATSGVTAFAERRDYHPGDSLPLSIDGKVIGSIPVSDLLP